MAFTLITITGSFERPDGSAASGSVLFTLTRPIQNGSVVIGAPVRGYLLEGALKTAAEGPLRLCANDDPATEPAGTSYLVELQIDSEAVRAFYIVVPHTAVGGTVDLTALEAGGV